ncbi:MAG: glucose-6-phosphate dehydrogenase [Gammaproteobacteria bacterium]|nr:glucose-6-phosphate dehydrogenase [Gammaproteobacteria bacterium]
MLHLPRECPLSDEARVSSRIVLFGGSGDLSIRMLFPSLYLLDRDRHLPAGLSIVAAARAIPETGVFCESLRETIGSNPHVKGIDGDVWQRFASRVSTVHIELERIDDYSALAERSGAGGNDATLYYLAISPRLYGAVCHHLKTAGLIGPHSRVVLEKPIGYDIHTSREINRSVATALEEDAIFRVDHYLGKETVQNLLALRFANSLLEPLWNRNGIDHVQITIAETVGVEGRWSYYDESGALRDMVQNHMLQLLCLVAMEPPIELESHAVRDEKVKVLRALRPINAAEVRQKSVRGQYAAGAIDGKPVVGYCEESGGKASNCESFVALRAEIDNWRWRGVPFYLRTGKRMPKRYTEIFIQFRDVPHSIFPTPPGSGLAANKLIIRLQPEEEITLWIMNKVPGLTSEGTRLQALPLNLSRATAFQNYRRGIAYERLILDALHANRTLFVRRDEGEAAWAWVDRIIAGWEAAGMTPQSYSAGSWGPSSAFALTERFGHTWHEA